MSEEKKINADEETASPEQETTSANETNAGAGETTKDYEVGYKRPPKSGQFKKGFSGNPSGRAKKVLDFDAALQSGKGFHGGAGEASRAEAWDYQGLP